MKPYSFRSNRKPRKSTNESLWLDQSLAEGMTQRRDYVYKNPKVYRAMNGLADFRVAFFAQEDHINENTPFTSRS